MNAKVGERIGAICGSRPDGSVDFYGYGVRVEDAIPVEAVGFMADMIREVGNPNPKLLLDSGEVVYGCECWWGLEGAVRKKLDGTTVHQVSITKVREDFTRINGKDAP